jgi:glutamyl-Q tRNA(Asp) synthetase
MEPYRGRYAPSPTGPLHFGSLIAAVGSYLEAKSRGGEWLLRMEDLDAPREQPGAAEAILRTLEACGIRWDGEPMYQSRRGEAYRAALARLEAPARSMPAAVPDGKSPIRAWVRMAR